MEIVGYICCLVIGFSLGALGAGGSILTVPIMVYLLGVDESAATSSSLIVVGVTAAIGASQKRQFLDFTVALRFGIVSTLSVYITKTFFVPMIPEVFMGVPKQKLTMLLFAFLMMAASYKMLVKNNLEPLKADHWRVLQQGLLVGFLTGMLGVGGGFLIVPVLVLYSGLQMKQSAATSLIVIAMNCAVGVLGSMINGFESVTKTTVAVTMLSVVGMLIGLKFAVMVNQKVLEKVFACVIAAIAMSILIKETF